MKPSTPLVPSPAPLQIQGPKVPSLSSWSKNTQQRFQFKLYTYHPKANQSQRNDDLPGCPSPLSQYQCSPPSKIARTAAQDSHADLRKQLETSKEVEDSEEKRVQGAEEKRVWDSGEKMEPEDMEEMERVGKVEVVTATPSKLVKKKGPMARATCGGDSNESWKQGYEKRRWRKRRVVRKPKEGVRGDKGETLAIKLF